MSDYLDFDNYNYMLKNLNDNLNLHTDNLNMRK